MNKHAIQKFLNFNEFRTMKNFYIINIFTEFSKKNFILLHGILKNFNNYKIVTLVYFV